MHTPCPFCGSKEIEAHNMHPHFPSFLVCTECRAISGDAPTIEGAAKEWDRVTRAAHTAPDLLAALKTYRNAQPQCTCTTPDCKMEAARRLADAAIAKAEGKAQ